MRNFKIALILPAIGLLAACSSVGPDKTRDRGNDSKHLSQLQAGIWVDPNGCDHWIIDDGELVAAAQDLDAEILFYFR